MLRGDNHVKRRLKGLISRDRTRRGTPLGDKSMQLELKILYILVDVAKEGIKHVDLAKKASIDRKNLTRHMKRLIHQRLVSRRKGRQGKYFINENIVGDTSGILFGHKAVRLLPIEPRDSLIVKQMPTPFVDFTSIREFGREAKKFGITRDLFEFSNIIGAYTLFVLIQAMNPANRKLYENKRPNFTTAQLWSERALSYIVPYLFSAFRTYIQFSFLENSKFESEEEHNSFVKNDERVYDELIAYYAKLYPAMFYELNQIRNEYLV